MALGLSAAVGAQTASSKAPPQASGTDNAFVLEAATGGLAEVELGRLATQKAQNNDVKQFGQRMVDDHSRANDQLKPIAEQRHVTVPTVLSGKEKALYDRLAKLSGEAFDRAYMRAMVDDHKEDVAAFRHESTNGKDPDVKQFASQTLPTLEDHLKMAQTTANAASTAGHGKTSATGTSGTAGAHGADRPASEPPPSTNPTTGR
jgi:putative membrane protein